MRVVIDTNVLVSGLISRAGPPAQIIDAVVKGRIIPVMSEATFAELEEVLYRPRLQSFFHGVRVTPFQLLTVLRTVAVFTKPGRSGAPIRDVADRPFLELAASQPPPDFIITGDKDFEQDHYRPLPPLRGSGLALQHAQLSHQSDMLHCKT